MSINKHQIYVDCGSSKIRAGAFQETSLNKTLHVESKFFFKHTEIRAEINKIIMF